MAAAVMYVVFVSPKLPNRINLRNTIERDPGRKSPILNLFFRYVLKEITSINLLLQVESIKTTMK